MTNSKPRRRCPDCKRVLTRANHTPAQRTDMCDDCFHVAGLYNEHTDGFHEGQDVPDCELCGHEIQDRSGPAGSTIPREMQTHAACYAAGTHEKSKAGRAACRKGKKV